MKRALIIGITGQDGSYLAELLLHKGCEVFGIIRRTSTLSIAQFLTPLLQDAQFKQHLHLEYGDLNDASSLNKILRSTAPDEIYNLAAQSHVQVSFAIPKYTGEITGMGVVRLLEAIREASYGPVFTKPPPASSTVRFRRFLRRRRHLSIRAALMRAPRRMLFT